MLRSQAVSTYLRAITVGVQHDESLRIARQKFRGPGRVRSDARGAQHYAEQREQSSLVADLLRRWRR